MEKPDPAQTELQKTWDLACKLMLGAEIGPLEDYADWICAGRDPMTERKSSKSDSVVTYAVPHYDPNSRWASFDEFDFGKKFEPLGINDVKDIDSIIEAVQERIYYAGNVVLGNSKFVSKSSNVTNSHYVLGSGFVSDSKNIAYSSFIRYSENLFGANNDTTSNFIIRGLDTYGNKRAFEGWSTYNCSDSYFTFGCEDCQNIMFSFNVKGRPYVIGNLQLSPEKYRKIRGKLVEDMRAELISKKKLPSLVEILSGGETFGQGFDSQLDNIKKAAAAARQEGKTDRKPIEKAFDNTFQTLFGEQPKGFDEYGDWLTKYGREVWKLNSCISGQELYASDIIPYKWIPKERVVTREESLLAGDVLRIGEAEAEKLTLENTASIIGKIACFTTEIRLKTTVNLIETAVGFSAQNCYKGGMYCLCKFCAFTYWPRDSERLFGCNTVFSSSSCIKSYYSNNISRCFEVDSCNYCSDSYFLHNCENVRDSMFCFNTKNL
ncbi:MAG: hypothetical protein NT157_05690, partial [Candidatus Micrarchaeota archaeon]|nr:hypothetical protein [Candidatus Micrarchaeota archaeon]